MSVRRCRRLRSELLMASNSEKTYRCTTLLPDEETVCWKEISSSEIRCSAHQEEYIRLSRDCAALGDKVDVLKDGLKTTCSPQEIGDIKTVEEVRDTLARVDAVLRAMTSEIATRKSQHVRYCGNGMSPRLRRD